MFVEYSHQSSCWVMMWNRISKNKGSAWLQLTKECERLRINLTIWYHTENNHTSFVQQILFYYFVCVKAITCWEENMWEHRRTPSGSHWTVGQKYLLQFMWSCWLEDYVFTTTTKERQRQRNNLDSGNQPNVLVFRVSILSGTLKFFLVFIAFLFLILT